MASPTGTLEALLNVMRISESFFEDMMVSVLGRLAAGLAV